MSRISTSAPHALAPEQHRKQIGHIRQRSAMQHQVRAEQLRALYLVDHQAAAQLAASNGSGEYGTLGSGWGGSRQAGAGERSRSSSSSDSPGGGTARPRRLQSAGGGCGVRVAQSRELPSADLAGAARRAAADRAGWCRRSAAAGEVPSAAELLPHSSAVRCCWPAAVSERWAAGKGAPVRRGDAVGTCAGALKRRMRHAACAAMLTARPRSRPAAPPAGPGALSAWGTARSVQRLGSARLAACSHRTRRTASGRHTQRSSLWGLPQGGRTRSAAAASGCQGVSRGGQHVWVLVGIGGEGRAGVCRSSSAAEGRAGRRTGRHELCPCP